MSWGVEAAIVIGLAALGILILPGGRSRRPTALRGPRPSAYVALRRLRATVTTPLTRDPAEPHRRP
ncbi:MAG: hypothetical protein AAF211_12845 [Myxococcota bacterium]